MSKRESIRKEAERRGVSHGTVFRERKVQHIIDNVDEDYPVVQAWRWSNDGRYAKIGSSKNISRVEERMVTTYHPTDDPVLIGFMRCSSPESAKVYEKEFLDDVFERTRPDREQIIIDEAFHEIIDEAFVSDPHELKKIFGGNIKTERSCNGNF